MEKFALLRVFLAREMIALNPRNVILGAIVQQIINEEYLPKLKRDLERIREDDVSKRTKVEKVIKLWEDAVKSDEWNNKAVYIIRNISRKFRVTDDEAEEAAQDIATNIYTVDKKFYNMLYDHDPMNGPDGSKGLMGLWNRAVSFRANNYFRKLMQEKALTTKKMNMVIDDEGGRHDPLDDISGGHSEAESELEMREVNRIIKEMRTHVLRAPNVKRSETTTAVFLAYMEALEKVKNRVKNDGFASLSRIKFTRDITPIVNRQYDIGTPQILQLYRKHILPAMADYLADQFSGSETYFRKLLKASEGDMAARVAEDFYRRDVKAWAFAPALKIQEALRCYAEV